MIIIEQVTRKYQIQPFAERVTQFIQILTE